MRRFLLPALLLLPAPALGGERYELRETGSGYVRLDTETGAMSTCTEKDGQFVCRMAADDRQALEDETERLRAQMERLEARVAALEKARPAALPSDAEIERTLGVVEKLFRGFVDITRELDRDGSTGRGGAGRI